jgi:hypothetical protein
MLALGSDAGHVMCAQLSARLEVLEAQREPARSTDFPPVEGAGNMAPWFTSGSQSRPGSR